MNEYESIRRTLTSDYADIWKAIHLRNYCSVPGYQPDVPAINLGSICAAVSDGIVSDQTSLMASVTAGYLVRYRVPMWFLPRDLVLSLDRTEPPESITWADLRFPFPAGVIQLPAGMCTDSQGCEYTYVTWCRTTKGERISIPGTPESIEIIDDGLIFTTSSVNNPRFETLVKSFNSDEWPSFAHMNDMESLDVPLSDTENDVIRRLASIASNSLLYALARPEAVERGSRLRKARETRNGVYFAEEWSPNWLGRSYSISRPQGGTHAALRLHWRRGHWRQQAHGRESSLRKLVWIEPILVGAGR